MMTRSFTLATLACLQTATAENPTWRSAAATLQENPRTHSNGVRRRLPSFFGKETSIDRELEQIDGDIAVQQKMIDDINRSNAKYPSSDHHQQEDAKAIETAELKIQCLEDEKKEQLEKESFLHKMQRKRQKLVGHWKNGNCGKKGLIAGVLAGGMGAGIITAAMFTKLGFKDFKDINDTNGFADKSHMFSAMAGVALFFVFYMATIYLLFGANKGQFWTLFSLGFVGSTLACSGMITMMSHNPEIASYGQSLIFGQSTDGSIQAVTWCFSLGGIIMALALVFAVGFLVRNKWCPKVVEAGMPGNQL